MNRTSRLTALAGISLVLALAACSQPSATPVATPPETATPVRATITALGNRGLGPFAFADPAQAGRPPARGPSRRRSDG